MLTLRIVTKANLVYSKHHFTCPDCGYTDFFIHGLTSLVCAKCLETLPSFDLLLKNVDIRKLWHFGEEI